MTDITIDSYSSHLPLLVAAVASTTGTIVELGAGLYSTPILQALCGVQNRPLLTFDNDAAWLDRVRHPNGGHSGALVLDSWEDLARYGEALRCDVAFVDVAPADARAFCIDVMARWARIIVVHDIETEQRHNYPGVEEQLQRFAHRVEDRRRGPWTAAVSNEPLGALRRAIR